MNALIDLIFYIGGLVIVGAALFTGIFLSVAGYYFITDKVKDNK